MKDKKACTLNGVAGTASSAATCKWSLCQKGYLPPDRYAAVLAGHVDGATKGIAAQSPLINHCYFHRAVVTRTLIQRFLSSQDQQRCRVVFLGAGLDSLPLLLATGEYQLRHDDNDTPAAPCTYPTPQVVSVDLPEVMVTRASLLSAAGVSVEGDGYSCVAADLRDLPSLSHSLQAALSPTPLNGPVPTLFVLESVLGYLQPHEAQGLLRWSAEQCGGVSGCLVLDLLNVEGAVGQGVREAFAARGCGLQGLPEWSSSSHACRALGTQGWTHAWALQLGSAVRGLGARGWMGPGLEAFDEHAALHTFHRHYVVALGWRGPASLLHTITQPSAQTCKGDQSGLLMWMASLEARVGGLEGEEAGQVTLREVEGKEEGVWAQVRTLVLQGYAPLAAQSSAVQRMAKAAVEGDLNPEEGGQGQGGMWVAQGEGGRVHGCVALQVRGEVGEVKRLAVGRERRRQGLGSRLLTKVEEQARIKGVREIVAVTVEGMEAARHLYGRQGYTCHNPPAKRDVDSLWTFTKTL